MRSIVTIGVAVGSLFSVASGKCTLQKDCCSRLSKVLPGKVHFPDADIYDARIESIYSATASLEPWCLVLPETSDDVSLVMKVITHKSCPFGIRSGGHAAFANGNSVSDGITVDLGYLNSTRYDADAKVADVKPGARWGAVYDTLAEDGVAVVGGRVTGVGVGGLILGGGNSFHSGRHGFACNTVQSYEIVLADGSIVTATAEKHSDLFRGLCGGSGNFGIVTNFEMKAVDLKGGKEKPHIWGGTGIWMYDNPQLVNELVSFTNRAEEDDGASVFCAWLWVAERGPMAFTSACALEQVDDKEDSPLLEGLKELPGSLANTFRSGPISGFTDEVSSLVQHQKENIWGSSSFSNDPATIQFAVEQHKILSTRLSEALPDDLDARALLIFQPLTKPLLAHGANKNVLGLEDDAKKGPGMFTLLIVQVGSAENEKIARPIVREFEEAIDNYAKEAGTHWRWTYLNYVDFSRDPILSYGPENVKFLQNLAKEYDPKGVFQKLRKSGHKLPVKEKVKKPWKHWHGLKHEA